MSFQVLNCLVILKVYVTTLILKNARPNFDKASVALLKAVLLKFATPQAKLPSRDI